MADAHPQGPHAIAFMGSRQMGHCGSGAPPVGCSGTPCCTRAGKAPFCFCFWGCSTSSSASSGECEVRSITASVCCWEVCTLLHVYYRFRQAAETRSMPCTEELTQVRHYICKHHPCTHEGRHNRRKDTHLPRTTDMLYCSDAGCSPPACMSVLSQLLWPEELRLQNDLSGRPHMHTGSMSTERGHLLLGVPAEERCLFLGARTGPEDERVDGPA